MLEVITEYIRLLIIDEGNALSRASMQPRRFRMRVACLRRRARPVR